MAWSPTHVVPAGGLAAWDAPDPSRPQVTTLGERVELVVEQRFGDWAQVRGENGWTGWVDSRLLIPVAPFRPALQEQTASPQQPPVAPSQTLEAPAFGSSFPYMAQPAPVPGDRKGVKIAAIVGAAALVVVLVVALGVGLSSNRGSSGPTHAPAPTYASVIANNPDGYMVSATTATVMSKSDGTVTIAANSILAIYSAMHCVRGSGNYVLMNSVECFGSKITVGEPNLTIGGVTYPAGTLLTLDKDLKWIQVPSWT